MGNFVKVREMWVTGGANSLPHPFLERPKVRLTHWYGVVSHFVKPRVKNWALSKLARHKYWYQLMRLISAVGELEQFKCSFSWIKFEKETFLIWMPSVCQQAFQVASRLARGPRVTKQISTPCCWVPPIMTTAFHFQLYFKSQNYQSVSLPDVSLSETEAV